MDITTLIGFIAVLATLITGIILGPDGFDFTLLKNFIDGPSIFITFGGTLFALIAAFPLKAFKLVPKHIKMIFIKDKRDIYEYIEIITDLSSEARKKGLLALEGKANTFEDEFLKESVLLIVDAIEPDKLKSRFAQKMEYISKRNDEERKFYEQGAAFGPAFGMIGTLIGLVNMLKSMSLDGGAETLGLSMSVALITTFYGTVMANCFFTPIANKLEIVQDREMLYKEMIIEGVISIKEGENPRYVREKMINFLEQKDASKDEDKKSGKKEKKQKKEK